MNTLNPVALGSLRKLRSRLASVESTGLKSQVAQLGINMVDLMMWLVIAALLLAAALQGIGYYQQAAWTYQAKSDVASVRTYMEAQYTLNNNRYPSIPASDNAALVSAKVDIKLTGNNKVIAARSTTGTGWTATVLSAPLYDGGKAAFFNFGSADDTATTSVDESSNKIPATTVQLLPIVAD